ncbi:MAG: c-type cytochrome [Candidatus Flexifilum sp.]
MIRKTYQTIVFAFFLGAAALTAGCQGLGGEPNIVATLPPSGVTSMQMGQTGSQAEIASVMTLGAQVWEANCARCHGRMGGGVPDTGAPLPDLTQMPEARILASIQSGVRDVMPGFADQLTDEELRAVATYARMLSIAIARDPSLAQADAGGSAVAGAGSAEAAAPQAQTTARTGQIVGSVTNGTAGAPIPENLPLELHILLTDFSEQVVQTTANADGTFVFADVPLLHEYRYVVTANHGDLMFASEVVQGAVDGTEMVLPLTIYESGAPADAIVIEGISAQLVVQDGQLQVIEILRAVNTSDRVFFQINADASGGMSVQLQAPAGAQFQTAMGQQYVIADEGTRIADTRPIVPGESRLLHVRFNLPYTDGMLFDQVFEYPIDGPVDILLVNQGMALASEQLAAAEPLVSQGMTMARYTGQIAQSAGSRLSFALSGTPLAVAQGNVPDATPTGAAATDLRPLAYVLIGAGGSALLFALIITLRDRRKRTAIRGRTVGELLEAIASLDLRHKAGEIDQRDYMRQRAALKAQLSALMKAQQS